MSSEISIKVEQLNKCYHILISPQRLLQMLMRGYKQYGRVLGSERCII